MADTIFYATTNNHNDREVILFRPSLLISKPPTKEKRISVLVRMPLSAQSTMGAPSWIDSAYSYVAQHHDKVSPKIELKGYTFHFSSDNLFGQNVQANNGSMRKFEISEQGDEENPDVVLEFALRVPFSEALWSWLGAFAGDPVWIKFVPGVPEVGEGHDDDGPEIDDSEDDDEDEDDLSDLNHPGGNDGAATYEEDEDDAFAVDAENSRPQLVPSKSGPKDLAAYHENVVSQEQQKRGRGRPPGSKNKTVDPLTVNVAVADHDF